MKIRIVSLCSGTIDLVLILKWMRGVGGRRGEVARWNWCVRVKSFLSSIHVILGSRQKQNNLLSSFSSKLSPFSRNKKREREGDDQVCCRNFNHELNQGWNWYAEFGCRKSIRQKPFASKFGRAKKKTENFTSPSLLPLHPTSISGEKQFQHYEKINLLNLFINYFFRFFFSWASLVLPFFSESLIIKD